MQVAFATVYLLDVLHVFGNIVLIVRIVLGRIEACRVNINFFLGWNNELDSVESVAFAVAYINEVAAHGTVGRNNVALDFHSEIKAVITARIVQRLNVFKRKPHHEVLLGGIHSAEFFGNVELFFKLITRKRLVPLDIDIPRMFVIFVSKRK